MSNPESKKKLSVRLTDITKHNVGMLKMLNKVVLPVPYSDKFYADAVSHWPRENPFVFLAYHNETVVGGISARRETYNPKNPNVVGSVLLPGDAIKTDKKDEFKYRVYLTTLAVLEPYRRYGVASKLLKNVLDHIDNAGLYEETYLHVHVGNESAIKFYEKFGFEKTATLEGYYKNDVISPPDCFVLTRKTVVPESVSSSASN